MRQRHQVELERLGLSAVEAQIYLALLKKGGTWKATAVAATMQIPRSTVYLALNSLLDRGLVEAETGYGGRFSAVPAEKALPSLVAAEREELLQRQQELANREQVAGELAQELGSVASPVAIDVGADVIQVLRDPRAVAERFERLELEAERTVDVFIKAPLFISDGNPAQQKAQRRGVSFRGVYERAALEEPQNKPHLAKWIAGGEEARIYDGELPHKMAIFDSEIVLMPLIRPHEQTKTVLIRHPQLAQTLTVAFNHFWEQSQPIAPIEEPKSSDLTTGRNGHHRVRRKKQPKA
jgi:sugar-specific transcriptional regulator TrmB